jgi:hypothetical protein
MAKTVYNTLHYQLKALLKNPEFLKDIQNLKDIFTSFDVPIPETGFENRDQYDQWRDRYWEVRGMKLASPEYLTEVERLTGNEGKLSSGNYDKLQVIKESMIPLVYLDYLHNLLEKYGFNIKDKKLKHFIERYFFFNQQELKEHPLHITHKRNEKTGSSELFIKIEPWTTKKDLENAWTSIKEEQSIYEDYIERNVPWAEFDRDIEIYKLYKEVLKTRKVTKIKAADIYVYAQLHKKYPEINNDLIRKIYKKARNILERSDT